MKTRFALIAACLALAGCGPNITESRFFVSPDEAKKIAVIEELQGANDSSPWWTHVALCDFSAEPDFPANIIKLEGRGSIHVSWKISTAVEIGIEDSFSDLNVIDGPNQVDGVEVRLYLLNPRRNKLGEQVVPPKSDRAGG